MAKPEQLNLLVPKVIFRVWTYDHLYGMYGPPPSCKRKVKMGVGSAQMYPVFD
jgi:hypothetical protein